MHTLSYCLVYARDEEEALDRARAIWDDLEHRGMLCAFFDEDYARDRWGNIPIVMPAESKEAKKRISEAMEATKAEFVESLGKIRKMLSKWILLKGWALEEIFEKGDVDRLKMECRSIGSHEIVRYLYDNDGSWIENPKQLESVMSKYKCLYEDKGKENPYVDDKIWLVPVDVRY